MNKDEIIKYIKVYVLVYSGLIFFFVISLLIVLFILYRCDLILIKNADFVDYRVWALILLFMLILLLLAIMVVLLFIINYKLYKITLKEKLYYSALPMMLKLLEEIKKRIKRKK